MEKRRIYETPILELLECEDDILTISNRGTEGETSSTIDKIIWEEGAW